MMITIQQFVRHVGLVDSKFLLIYIPAAMKLTPKNKHLIVESISAELTQSGLVVPENTQDKRPSFGKVIAGTGEYLGKIVAFDRYEGHQFDIHNQTFFGVLEDRVIAIVEL